MNTPMDIKATKEALRREIKKRLREEETFFEFPHDVFTSLQSFELYQKARTVLLYASLPDEAPAEKLIELCLQDNKITALPRVAGKDMDFFILNPALSLAAQTQTGAFGITEPDPGLPRLSAEKAEAPILIFVPGLAFDKRGFRLGRGAGYYDRYLADFCGTAANNRRTHIKSITLIGLCRSIQIVEKVPAEAHDIRLDFLMSELGIQKTTSELPKNRSFQTAPAAHTSAASS